MIGNDFTKEGIQIANGHEKMFNIFSNLGDGK